jgi:hypothetical protein
MFLDSTEEQGDKPVFLRAVEAIVAGPDDIFGVVRECDERIGKRRKTRDLTGEDRTLAVAGEVIERYARTCGRVGSLTAAAGVIPGVGTVVALVGSAAADLVITMKYQIEMVMALAHLYGRDISTEDERRLCYAVAGLGVATQAGLLSFKQFTVQGLTEAAKKLLKTRAKQWLIKLFKMIGLRLTQKGLLRAIPFGVGVALGYSSNKKLTRYVGRRARDYFIESAS